MDMIEREYDIRDTKESMYSMDFTVDVKPLDDKYGSSVKIAEFSHKEDAELFIKVMRCDPRITAAIDAALKEGE